MNDVFALQEEIAGAIRLALGSLLDEGQVPRAAPPTRSVNALNQYLLGRFHWNKRDEAGFRAALAHFGSAIQIDPDYGRAYSGIADCYVMLAMSGAETPAASMPLAEQAALRALEIDDRLVEAHTSLGVVRANFHWDWTGSEIEFQRALESDPSYATLHHWYSIYALAPLGRFDEALDEIEWAEQLDPTSLTINLATRRDALSCRRLPCGCRPVHEGAPPRWTLLSSILVDGAGPRPAGQFRGRKRSARNGKSPGRVVKLPFGREYSGALGHTYGRWGKSDRALGHPGRVGSYVAIELRRPIRDCACPGRARQNGRGPRQSGTRRRATGLDGSCIAACGLPSRDLRPNTRFQALLNMMALRTSGDG